MAKVAKKQNNVNPLTRKLKQSASQIWLAGLGAYSKAEEEGNKLFDTLVREGETAKHLLDSIMDKPMSLYQETLGDVRECVEEVKDKAVGSWDRIEKAFDERVASALHRLNIPTRQDVADLAKQVMQCKAELRQLQNSPSKKSVAKAASAASAKPASAKPVTTKSVAAKTTAVKASTAKNARSKASTSKTVAAKTAVSKTVKAVKSAAVIHKTAGKKIARKPSMKKPSVKLNPVVKTN
jgi:poly(hydroxyalkanoate) granule-associated protein